MSTAHGANPVSDASSARPIVLLVHGAWHGAWCYTPLITALATQGECSVAIDLPGHGLKARLPESAFAMPHDPARYRSETSQVAHITLDDYVHAIATAIEDMSGAGFGPVTLVGHSMGGVAISAAAEKIPERIGKLVYLAAYMAAPGIAPYTYASAPEAQSGKGTALVVATPSEVGALRIDPWHGDTAYRAQLKENFYNDVDDTQAAAATRMLSADMPVQPFGIPSPATPQRWGRLPRYYIRTAKDFSVPPALQDRFIREADAATPGNPTRAISMDTGHSPFFSATDELARILQNIARS